MGCREEILECIDELERAGKNRFSPDEIVRLMAKRGSKYAESTVRTHVVSRMCRDAPKNHDTQHADLRRVADGLYSRA